MFLDASGVLEHRRRCLGDGGALAELKELLGRTRGKQVHPSRQEKRSLLGDRQHVRLVLDRPNDQRSVEALPWGYPKQVGPSRFANIGEFC